MMTELDQHRLKRLRETLEIVETTGMPALLHHNCDPNPGIIGIDVPLLRVLIAHYELQRISVTPQPWEIPSPEEMNAPHLHNPEVTDEE